jgi:hypothetical protein
MTSPLFHSAWHLHKFRDNHSERRNHTYQDRDFLSTDADSSRQSGRSGGAPSPHLPHNSIANMGGERTDRNKDKGLPAARESPGLPLPTGWDPSFLHSAPLLHSHILRECPADGQMRMEVASQVGCPVFVSGMILDEAG